MFNPKFWLLMVILLMNSFCFSQEKRNKPRPFISSEVAILFPHYFTAYQNQPNFGIGIGLSGNYSHFKITTGLSYCTKKYYEVYESTSYIDKVTYSLVYFNIPVMIGFPLISKAGNKNQFLISTGIVFNIPRNYQSETYFKNSNPPIQNDNVDSYSSGSSFHLELQFVRKINRIFNIYAGAFGDYKFKLEQLNFTNSTPQWHSTNSKDRFIMGLTIGTELIFRNKTK